MNAPLRSLAAPALCLSLSACGGAPEGTPSTTGAAAATKCEKETRAEPYVAGMEAKGTTVTVSLRASTPTPPSLGDNDWTLDVKDGSKKPLAGATLTVTQRMPDHGHGGVKTPVITDSGDGSYDVGPVNFNMEGYWENTVAVKSADGSIDDKAVLKLCVE